MNNFLYKLKVNPSIKALLVPTGVITVVVLVLIMFAPKGISTINKKMSEYKDGQSEEAKLEEKLSSLKEVSADLLDPDDISVVALPNKNPVIQTISHVKKISEEYDVNILKYNMDRAKGAKELKASSLAFEYETTEYSKFLSFVNDLIEIIPLTTLNSVSLERSENRSGEISFKGSIKNTFYWSDFPETLPSITTPINTLSNEDLKLIGVVSQYKQPAFIDLPPEKPRERQRPFE
jgi:hypothetical protein